MQLRLEDLLEELSLTLAYLEDIKVGIPENRLAELKKQFAQLSSETQEVDRPNLETEIRQYASNLDQFAQQVFSSLTPRQIDALTRSEQRPRTIHYIRNCFDSFHELGGSGEDSVDPAIVWGIATLQHKQRKGSSEHVYDNQVMVIGHEKGSFEEMFRNGGTASPKGNAQALKAMMIAEKLKIPIITFIDTDGANPLDEGLPAQQIAKNIAEQGSISVPHLSVVIGGGGSGGALALDVGDRRLMSNQSYYSVISIEGGAAIIAKDRENVTEEDRDRAANNLKLTSQDAKALGIIDEIIPEPWMGARLGDQDYFHLVRERILYHLNDLCKSPAWKLSRGQEKKLLKQRYEKYRAIGIYDAHRAQRFFTTIALPIRHAAAPLGNYVQKKLFAFEEKATPYLNRLFAQLKYLRFLGKIPWNKQLRYRKALHKKHDLDQKLMEATQDKQWVQCPRSKKEKCHDVLASLLFTKYLGVCPTCDYHHRISSQQYIDLLTDPGSFREFNRHIASANPLHFDGFDEKLRIAKEKTYQNSAMITGYAAIEGRRIILALMDFSFRGGTLGSAEGEKYVRAVDLAIRKRLPLVCVTQSGGVRIEEGLLGLMQMAKTGLAAARLVKKRIPYISIYADPCMAGALASYVSLAEITIAEPGAHIGLAGIRVIRETMKKDLPEDYQCAEQVLKRGGLDEVRHRKELRASISDLLSIYGKHTKYETIVVPD